MPKPPRLPVRRAPAPKFIYNPVPRLWPNSTIVCIGAGPSLTQADVDYVRGKARVIAINRSYENAMWADALYACDDRVWKWYWEDHKSRGVRVPGMKHFQGIKFALTRTSAKFPGVHVLKNTGSEGLELKPEGIKNGRNSGYQAVNLAVHLGGTRILLLAYDMARTGGKDHHHENHPNGGHSPYPQFRKSFASLVEPLKAHNIEVINCSRQTELTCFPRMSIQEALPHSAEAVA